MANKFSYHKHFKNFKKSQKQTEQEYQDAEGNSITLWYTTDKNGQICDCARIGNSLDILHGVPESIVDPYAVMINQL